MQIFLTSVLTFISILFYSTGFAQVNLSGRISDQAGHAVDLAEIRVLSKNSNLTKSEFTNTEGLFKINVEKGSFRLEVLQLGKLLYSRDLDLKESTELGTIEVQTELNLKEVSIGAKKKLIERKVDRLVFNVENSISAVGGDAVDALKITPGLKMKNELISIIGKSSVAVMIDDRIVQLSGDELISYLKTIKSQDISSIEVITNPPAKYSADGNSGLVNIKLKKAKADSWNASLISSYQQATYATGSYGGSFNYQKDKVAFFSNLNYSNGSKKGVEDETIGYVDDIWNNSFKRKVYTNILSGRFGFDYTPSKKVSLGFQYMGSTNKPKTMEDNVTSINNSSSGVVDSLIKSDVNNSRQSKSNSFNVHSAIKLDSSGRNASFDLDYFNLDNTINRNFQSRNTYADGNLTPYGYSISENTGIQKLRIYSAKIDMTHPTKWASLSYGAKLYFSETDYDNQYFDLTSGTRVLQSDRSNLFNYQENTQALYISGRKKIGKIEMQLGLRAENTQTRGNSLTLSTINKNHYMQFFPTAYIQYHRSEEHNFAMSFGRRLSRPRFNELNPFKVYSNPYSYTQGNPLLTPAFTNNLEFQHTYKEILTTALSFSRTTNGIGNPPFFDQDTKVSYLIDLNYYKTNSYTLSESYIFNPVDWLESENQASGFYTQTITDRALNLSDVKGFGAYLSSNNSFSLNKNKTIRFELNFWYQTRQYQDIYSMNSMYGLDAGIKMSTVNKRLQLTLLGQDLLRTDISAGRTVSGLTNYKYRDYSDSRFFRLSLTYTFGRENLSVNKKNFGNEEEKRRAGN